MNEDVEKLRSLLREVPNSYDDFVNGVVSFSKRHGIVKEMVDFILSSENITKNDVFKEYRRLSNVYNPLNVV